MFGKHFRSLTYDFLKTKKKNGQLSYAQKDKSIYCSMLIVQRNKQYIWKKRWVFRLETYIVECIDVIEKSSTHWKCAIKIIRTIKSLIRKALFWETFSLHIESCKNVLKRVVSIIKKLSSRGLAFWGEKILCEMKASKYFSLIVDSSRCVSNIGQLSILLCSL